MLYAQDTLAKRYALQINADKLKQHLSVIASDEYEGRETGQPGQKKAAQYIREQFASSKIPPYPTLQQGYYQTFPLDVYQPQRIEVKVNEQKFSPVEDYYAFTAILKDTSMLLNQLVFAGYGINTPTYNDYQGLDVKDKAVLILAGEPLNKQGKSMITGTTAFSEWTSNYRRKNYEAQQQKIKILFIADDSLAAGYKKNEHRVSSTRMEVSGSGTHSFQSPLVVYISTRMAQEMLKNSGKSVKGLKKKITKKATPVNINVLTNIQLNIKQEVNHLFSENVLAYIEGTDLKDEVLVITAHYDHLGIHDGKVYNGADDDGSGTVAVIELAKIFALAKEQGKGPRRSILFMTVAGEEKGLLGSEYYVEHPVFPLKNTVCNLNIDMIGRIDEAHKGNGNYIYLIGSDKLSKDLHELSEEANKLYTQLSLDYTFNDVNDPNRYYYRSDHYNFAKNNIPVIFYFNGVHEDYHQETDELSKIDFKKMEKISRLVFYTAWEIANRTERIKLNGITTKGN